MSEAETKAAGAFRTIGEVSTATGLPQHVLRYWETRFPQLKPLTRAGNRRYYRPEDVVMVVRIDRLLNHDGYTVKGVQKLLASEGKSPASNEPVTPPVSGDPLRNIRDRLKAALDAD